MAQTVIRIIYDWNTKKPKRFVIPDSDGHLAAHPPGDEEAHIDITNEDWAALQAPYGPNLQVIEDYIKSQAGA